jgi:riboflavin biosynthesis pyrimidine reductase
MIDWAERFDAFARRKEREALAAELSPFQTEQVAETEGLVPIGNRWTRARFDGDFYLSPTSADLPATGLVFVQSKDGNTGATDPASLGGGETDKQLVYEGLSRVAVHGVLAGAETIRGGDVVFSVWHPELVALRQSLGLPRHPVQIVATLRGLSFDDTLLYNVPELAVVVLTVPACLGGMREEFESRPWMIPVVMAGQNDLLHAFRRLRAMGIGRVSAIGGRTIARALIEAGLIQDLYLTTSGRPGGLPNTPLCPKPLEGALVVRKQGTGPEAGVRFDHLLLK